MRWNTPVLVLVVGLVAGCGDTPVISTTTPAPATSTITTTASMDSAANTSPPAPTTSTPPTTGPYRDDGTLRSLPPLSFEPLRDATATEVDWNALGPNWMVMVVNRFDSADMALYLVDPTDHLYLLGGWEPEWRLQDRSPDGRSILWVQSDGVFVLDLLDGLQADFTVEGTADRATLSRPDAVSVIVGRVYDYWESSVVPWIRVFDFDGSLSAELLFGRPSTEPGWAWWGPTWVSDPSSGQIVVADPDGIRLISANGTVIGVLDAPATDCQVVRWWSNGVVLATCIDPAYAASDIFECWPDTGRSLWAVPLDGSSAYPIGPRIGPGGPCDSPDPDVYQPSQVDAVQTDDALFTITSGCCECGGDLQIHIAGETLVPEATSCGPRLVGLRHGNALIVMTISDDRFYSVAAEVGSDGQPHTIRSDLTDTLWVMDVLAFDG